MGLLDGKRILVTGVLSERSIAFSVARLAQREGAEVVLTGAGRGLSLTARAARRLDVVPEVLELDVTCPEHFHHVAGELERAWGGLDGLLHAVAFAPPACLGGNFLSAEWEHAGEAIHVSAYSLQAMTAAFLPLFEKAGGGSVVGLDFDARVAWPVYDWMGVAKAALEATARYLARDVGRHAVRVNLVASGPLETTAARALAGLRVFGDLWADRAPLGWDTKCAESAARACVALLSDWFDMTTGEIIHVDGGFHAVGV
jgi:enoyl-[acyl-carrier protein] reductase I